YGIRIENLVLVTEKEMPDAEKPMLGFETLSYVPIERALIDADMLTIAEREWLNAYHTETERRLAPLLEGDARQWLSAACAPV
ncbi:MAG: M24 family metallopeptidase C-terminal domain-containing protein, partial [Sphingomonas sp.]|nr:M24 family metallopeptidase C-terminal domain-containing protein [Sphingomonas sp.]